MVQFTLPCHPTRAALANWNTNLHSLTKISNKQSLIYQLRTRFAVNSLAACVTTCYGPSTVMLSQRASINPLRRASIVSQQLLLRKSRQRPRYHLASLNKDNSPSPSERSRHNNLSSYVGPTHGAPCQWRSQRLSSVSLVSAGVNTPVMCLWSAGTYQERGVHVRITADARTAAAHSQWRLQKSFFLFLFKQQSDAASENLVAHQKPKAITEFQGFYHAVVDGPVQNYVKELKNPLLIYFSFLFCIQL